MKTFLPAVHQADGTLYGNITGTGRRNTDPDENLFNCIPWVLHNGEIAACPRNEFTQSSNVPNDAADRGRGLATFGGEIDLYMDQTNYYWDGGNTDLTATSSPGYAGNTGFNEEFTGSFVEHKVSGVPNLVIVNAGHASTHASANHGNVWYAADAQSAPASVSDADMPGNNGVSLVRGGASLDGYLFLGDVNGQIHNSNLNDITAWTATDFITASRDSGIGVYVGRHHDDVVSISTQGIEFFYNAGNASGSPLGRRGDVYHSIGCYFPNSIVEAGDIIYFVGTEKGTGATAVYVLENYTLTVLSDIKINELLHHLSIHPNIADLDSLEHAMWMSYTDFADSPGLILTNNYFWTYYWHKNTNKWCYWQYTGTVTYTGGADNNWQLTLPIMAHNGTPGKSNSRYQLINGRIVYESVIVACNDAMNDWASSNTPVVFMQFPRWDAGTDRKKRVNWVRVITAPVSTDSSLADPSNVDLKWFDYSKSVTGGPIPPDTNYSTARTVNLNVRGARVSRCGTTRERSFILDWPLGHGPVTVVKGLEIDYDIVGE